MENGDSGGDRFFIMSSVTIGNDVQPGEIEIPEALRLELLLAANQARFGDAYQTILATGPLEQWAGAEARLLAGRLSRHLGNHELYWKLTAQAYRQKPHAVRFQTQRIYALMERCGNFAAWEAARKLAQAEAESDEERADGLICEGLCNVVYRDFQAAENLFRQAQALEPKSAWVWSESSSLPAEQRKYEAAIELADRALEVEPYFRSALLRKASYLQSLRRDDEAFDVLETGRRHLQSGGVISQLIILCSEREEWARMLELVDEAERLTPYADEGGRSWYTARRADAELGLGNFVAATARARQVTKNQFYENLADRLERHSGKERRVKIPVPFIQQGYNTCAPATLSAITSFWENPIAQDTLIGEICYDGTFDFVERRWAEKGGWHAREFKVDWDVAVALLDRGIPFILSTQEINSGHSQAVMGYDTVRGSLLIRDPNHRHHSEYAYEEFEKHYAPVGPRGFLLLPQGYLDKADGIMFPEAELYDHIYGLNCALEAHDRDRAESFLNLLDQQAPNHRLAWMGRRALAHYDQNPLAQLEAVDGLLNLFPDDDRLLHVRLQLLRGLGRNHEAHELIKNRCARKNVPGLFWREYAREVRQEKNKSQAAMRLTRKCLKWMPSDIDTLTVLSGILWSIKNRTEAMAVQRLAVCVGDKREPVAEAYFQMQEACGQTDSGIEFLRERYQALIGQSSAPAITLANCLDRLNRAREVREVLHETLERRPDDGDLLLRFSQFESAGGNLEECSNLLQRAAGHIGRLAWLRAAAFLERANGNFDLALEHWQGVVGLAPLDVEAHRQITWLLARRDGKAVAQDYAKGLGRQFPQHRGLLDLELNWVQRDEPEEAESRLTAYLQSHPTDAWARREYVLLLQKRQAYDEALAHAEEARQYDPYQSTSWQVEGSVLESMNRLDEARERIRKALELNIDSTYGMRRLVFLADSVTEKKEALEFIQQQFDRQSTAGAAITAYREIAFPILDMPELTEKLRAHWSQRPDLWEAWHTLLHHLISAGQLEEASQIAAGATDRFSILPIVWRDAARLNQQLGAWPEAASCLRHALRINPDWVPVVCDLAGVYRRGSQFDEARELLERSHRRNPLDAPVLGTLADLLWHLGERETALGQVRRAIENDPDYNWGWATLAHWSDLLQGKNLAIDLARERAKRLDRDASAWLRLAQLAHRPEMAGERLEAALRARECEPRNIDAHDAVASAFAEQRRYDEAIQACRPGVFGEHVPFTLRGREAWLFSQQDKMAEAMKTMGEVVATDPHYVWGWDRLADWYFGANRFSDSIAACEKGVRLNPMSATGYGKRARAYLKLNKNKEAKLDFQRAMGLDPGYGYAGWQLFKMQIAEKAYADAGSTLSAMRAHTSAGIMLPSEIILACKRGKFDEALKLLQQAALLIEVDTGVVDEAMKCLDSCKLQKRVNKLLSSLITDPSMNPYMAHLWAERMQLAVSWRLFSHLKKIPVHSRVLEPVLHDVILGSKKASYPVRLIKRVVARYPEATRKHTQVWSVVGQIFATGKSWQKCAEWLKDWESRPDVRGWMVTNRVFALQVLRRVPEADETSQKLLARGLRDHTAAYHLLYLALSALERHDTDRARELLGGVHLESDHKEDKFFKLAVEGTLHVQEAEPGSKRRETAARARSQLSRMALRDFKIRRVLRAEARAALLMARDARSVGAWAYAVRINITSWLAV